MILAAVILSEVREAEEVEGSAVAFSFDKDEGYGP